MKGHGRTDFLDSDRAEAWTIGLLLALTLGLRLYILPERWINPDEGAHLMDALLVLRGYVPEVDFIARQPLYVYAMSGFFALTGVSLEAGRLFPLICSLLVGLPLYLLARELFDRAPALLALAAWWMLPFEIRASTVVKTEPFATLLAVSAVYAAVRAVRSPRNPSAAWMIGAGMLAAGGFYVRESALVIPPVVLIYLVGRHGGRIRATLRDFGRFLAGYAGVCLLAALFYSRWIGASAFVEFTPVHFVAGALASAAQTLPEASVSEVAGTSRAYGEDASEYIRSIRDGVFFLLFLIVGAGFAGLNWLVSLFRPGRAVAESTESTESGSTESGVDGRAAMALALSWTVLLGIAYAWHFSQRGFWVDYSREFAPPLILAVAGWLPAVAPALRERASAIRLIAGVIVLGWLWILFQGRFRAFWGIGHHASLGLVLFLLFRHARDLASSRRRVYVAGMVAVVALIVGARYTPLAPIFSGAAGSLLTLALAVGFVAWMLSRSDRRPIAELARTVPLGLVVGALVVTLSHGALRFNVKFQGLWSTEALADVAHYLRETTSPDDRVMSGGVVWELQAERLPWELYSHPMAIQTVLPADVRGRLTDTFEADPPEVIVMDGITERTFGPNIESLEAALASDYRLIMRPEPVSFDVAVYRRIPPAEQP